MDESINLDLCNPKSLKGPFEPCQLISMIYDIMYQEAVGETVEADVVEEEGMEEVEEEDVDNIQDCDSDDC